MHAAHWTCVCTCEHTYHTAYTYLHFKSLGKLHFYHSLVFSYFYFTWTPLVEGGSADRWFQPRYFQSLFFLYSAPAPLSEHPADSRSAWDIPAYHPLVQRVPVRPLFIRAAPQRKSMLKCLNVETTPGMSEATSSSHLLENSYLFSIILPVAGSFVGWAPTQTPCCILLLPWNICIAIRSFFF